MKKLSVDLPDDIYKALMKVQYEQFEATGTKPSLKEIVIGFISDGLSQNKKASQ